MLTLLDLTERNANHIIPSYCNLLVIAEVQLTGVASFGAVNHRFNFNLMYTVNVPSHILAYHLIAFNVMIYSRAKFLTSCTPPDRHVECKLYFWLECFFFLIVLLVVYELRIFQWRGVNWPSIYLVEAYSKEECSYNNKGPLYYNVSLLILRERIFPYRPLL